MSKRARYAMVAIGLVGALFGVAGAAMSLTGNYSLSSLFWSIAACQFTGIAAYQSKIIYELRGELRSYRDG